MKKVFLVLLAVLLLCGCAQDVSVPYDVIDTEYFTLPLLPGIHYNILSDGDRYSIEFYERQDYETNGTGLLCTLKLYKEGEDFTVPGHTLYGMLVTKKLILKWWSSTLPRSPTPLPMPISIKSFNI